MVDAEARLEVAYARSEVLGLEPIDAVIRLLMLRGERAISQRTLYELMPWHLDRDDRG